MFLDVDADEWAFLDEIQIRPDDETARLIYADWLESRGDPRADYLRIELWLPRLEKGGEDYTRCAAPAPRPGRADQSGVNCARGTGADRKLRAAETPVQASVSTEVGATSADVRARRAALRCLQPEGALLPFGSCRG